MTNRRITIEISAAAGHGKTTTALLIESILKNVGCSDISIEEEFDDYTPQQWAAKKAVLTATAWDIFKDAKVVIRTKQLKRGVT